ncbi:endonuclease/exonuclease/phosphatase family protein [Flavobacterium sp.]|uniref:endonuclease/exonuclease/phosphatase family protein n=1 Tax=Flavobacterium sp. TaxID=239 RepID=UPI00262ED8A2|nr:endonuclease/exonuclease/phosphatase family protein [Flavobacterium sp.]MDG2430864.1 endonuclease/exonuclease/phosphatase family protein [Flavobacterium sp.]
MTKLLLVFFSTLSISAQTKLLSWNIENLGKSKSNSEIAFMANTIKDFDIIAIQEVVAGYGGAQAVARLADELNRKGSSWDYVISDPTSSSAYKTERYAFLWKKSKVKKIGRPWLEKKYHLTIDREPYICTFEYDNKQFTVINYHAITKNRQPETEIKYFKFLPLEYPKLNLIFAGDWNCPQAHTVFNPLKKMGYQPAFINQKTSLKKERVQGQYLASEFDNIFYSTVNFSIKNKGVIAFYKDFNSLQEARTISDHIPIWIEFSIN